MDQRDPAIGVDPEDRRVGVEGGPVTDGQPIAALDEEEGRLADGPNQGACLRAWDLWRKQVRDENDW